MLPAIDVLTLAGALQQNDHLLVIDVRENHERDICRLDNTLDIPLGELPDRLADIPKDRALVMMCHHGRRSARATQYLLQNGFASVSNLTGGIDAWAVEIDPAMTRY